jgi:hypothetical protein
MPITQSGITQIVRHHAEQFVTRGDGAMLARQLTLEIDLDCVTPQVFRGFAVATRPARGMHSYLFLPECERTSRMWPVTDASLDRLVGISTPGDRGLYFAAKPEQPPRGAARKREREQAAPRVLDHRRRRPMRMQ